MSDAPVSAPPSFLKAFVASIIRHSLTGAAGAMAAAGMIQKDQTSSFIEIGVSLGLWGFSLWWSALQKKKTHA